MRALSNTNLADEAIDAIRGDILGKRWAVGEKFPNEASLSAMLSVSRGTVREARSSASPFAIFAIRSAV
ncbi:GntR family transcriptional regulator, partial [Rhizobium leguminosarum]|uniref:GntR family transcriptional regulator n=1 Tax=Rhizobium leguminosarum TaxID=384 RepID=UPI003F986B7F